jgi:peptidyl-prolyl cis-trans isomerase B (cyclophilin B)
MLRTVCAGKVAALVATIAGVVMLGAWESPALGQEKKAPPAASAPSAEKKPPHAIIKTKFGEMEIKFFPDLAPKHVENFIKLAKGGVYNGTIFHRVIPGFMIQGGDPNTKDPAKKETYGQGGPGHSVKAEFNDTPHKRGIVSMARAADPDSAGSQFFIVVEDSRFLDAKYTVFGEVVKGIGVADKIVSQPRVVCDAQGRPTPAGQGSCDNPLERIEMTVTIVE